MFEKRINPLGNQFHAIQNPLQNIQANGTMLRSKSLVVEYKNSPILIQAGKTVFKIIKINKDIKAPWQIIQTPEFNETKPTDNELYYKGLWENVPVEIGRTCPDARRFNLDKEVSRRHFSVTRKRDKFTITDLGSSNGTFITKISESDPPSCDKDDIIKKNIEKIFSRDFREVLLYESIGGNAGPGHAGVNGYADKNGRIICFGNYQDLPDSIRKNNELFPIAVRVRVFGNVKEPKYEFSDYFGSLKNYEEISKVISEAVSEANKIEEQRENLHLHGIIASK
jgi:hypothetical protein